jgi:hypothetical protein
MIAEGQYHEKDFKSFLNDGNGNFSLHQSFSMPHNTKQSAVGDMDGDGYIDILSPVTNASNVIWYFRNNNSLFELESFNAGEIYDRSNMLFDINFDGTLEILAFTGNEIVVYAGQSSNQQPIADAGEDQIVECTGTNGTEVTLDGTGSFDPDGDDLTYNWTWDGGSTTGPTPTVVLPQGTTTITLVVNDGTLDSDTDEVDITVEDNAPPEIIIGTEMLTLWPANHKYESIHLNEFDIEVIDGCDENVSFDDLLITSVSSDEEENGKGDGNTVDDLVLVDCQEVKLRKERSGNGNGRVYSINIAVTDNSGNEGTATCYVTVPHNKKKDAIDDGIAYSIEGCVGNGARRDYAADNEKKEVLSPNDLHLSQNFPNPFNPTTTIKYQVAEAGFVVLKVYDVLGNEVANLVGENKENGSYSIMFDATNLPSGIYIYQLKVNSFIETKKMILMK